MPIYQGQSAREVFDRVRQPGALPRIAGLSVDQQPSQPGAGTIEDPGLLAQLRDFGLTNLNQVVNVLDLPASSARDIIGGFSTGDWNKFNPLDQWGNAWTGDKGRFSGREMLREAGFLRKGAKDSWRNFGAGLVADMLLDPLLFTGKGFFSGIKPTAAGDIAKRLHYTDMLGSTSMANSWSSDSLRALLQRTPKTFRKSMLAEIRKAAKAGGHVGKGPGQRTLREFLDDPLGQAVIPGTQWQLNPFGRGSFADPTSARAAAGGAVEKTRDMLLGRPTRWLGNTPPARWVRKAFNQPVGGAGEVGGQAQQAAFAQPSARLGRRFVMSKINQLADDMRRMDLVPEKHAEVIAGMLETNLPHGTEGMLALLRGDDPGAVLGPIGMKAHLGDSTDLKRLQRIWNSGMTVRDILANPINNKFQTPEWRAVLEEFQDFVEKNNKVFGPHYGFAPGYVQRAKRHWKKGVTGSTYSLPSKFREWLKTHHPGLSKAYADVPSGIDDLLVPWKHGMDEQWIEKTIRDFDDQIATAKAEGWVSKEDGVPTWQKLEAARDSAVLDAKRRAAAHRWRSELSQAQQDLRDNLLSDELGQLTEEGLGYYPRFGRLWSENPRIKSTVARPGSHDESVLHRRPEFAGLTRSQIQAVTKDPVVLRIRQDVIDRRITQQEAIERTMAHLSTRGKHNLHDPVSWRDQMHIEKRSENLAKGLMNARTIRALDDRATRAGGTEFQQIVGDLFKGKAKSRDPRLVDRVMSSVDEFRTKNRDWIHEQIDRLNDVVARGGRRGTKEFDEAAAPLREALRDHMVASSYDRAGRYHRYFNPDGTENANLRQLANRLMGLDKKVLERGLYDSNPFTDLQAKLLTDYEKIGFGQGGVQALLHPEVIARAGGNSIAEGRSAAGETVPVHEHLQELGFKGELADPNSPISQILERHPELKNRSVPRSYHDDLTRIVSERMAPDEASGLIGKAWDSFTNMVKTHYTGTNPAFHVRNRMSGWIQNLLHGWVRSPTQWIRHNRMAKTVLAGGDLAREQLLKMPAVVERAEELRRGWKSGGGSEIVGGLSGKELNAAFRQLVTEHSIVSRFQGRYASLSGQNSAQAAEEARRLPGEIPGATTWGAVKKFVGWDREPGVTRMQAASPWNVKATRDPAGWPLPPFFNTGEIRSQSKFAPAVGGEEIGYLIEGHNRLEPFIDMLERGEDAASAARKITDAHVSYDPADRTPFEKRVGQRVLPFYKYLRGSLPYTASKLADPHSGIRNFTKAEGAFDEGRDKAVPLPGHLRDQAFDVGGQFGLKPGTYLSQLGLMHEDALGILGGLTRGSGSDLVDQVMSKTNPLVRILPELAFDRDFFYGRPPGDNPVLTQIAANRTGLKGRPESVAPWLEHIIGRGSPWSRYLSTIKTAGDPRKTWGEVGLHLAGLPRTVNVIDASRASEVQAAASELARSLGAREFKVPYFPGDLREKWESYDPDMLRRSREVERLLGLLRKLRREENWQGYGGLVTLPN